MPDVEVKGRHITQHPGPLEHQDGRAEWYGESYITKIDGVKFVKVRIDDKLHPEFWVEVLVPLDQLLRT